MATEPANRVVRRLGTQDALRTAAGLVATIGAYLAISATYDTTPDPEARSR